jgi:hypothetical protein
MKFVITILMIAVFASNFIYSRYNNNDNDDSDIDSDMISIFESDDDWIVERPSLLVDD